ncbi:DUF3606 domain-containing protein [Eleftheria terrae]|uniref:DUF3606 domain-containing protein n=1 Tax=Eleftheria terrae TaxID=1597781 RepID=UPI00263B58B9|nr:DUF3606 domain-containing protein [Eleftheria terrae]WKB54711.1 DUF3606 domain-containing protein [Eleftheria terrae]
MPSTSTPAGGPQGPRIDIHREQDLREWSRKLDATPEQLKEAVQAVGDSADDVEMHLKGSRSTTNSDRMSGEAPRH